jgi:hypothetical protein
LLILPSLHIELIEAIGFSHIMEIDLDWKI